MRLRPSNYILTQFKAWREVMRQRRQLRALDDQMLKDIGISSVDALQEADRHFWDQSSHCDSTLRSCRDSFSDTNHSR